MLLYPITLLLWFPVYALTYDRLTHFRPRRVPVASSAPSVQPKRNLPFVIRVPYSKIIPSNALFSHSVSWRAKQRSTTTPPASRTDAALTKSADESSSTSPVVATVDANVPEASSQTSPSDLEVSQFHAQDTNGQVVFGFSAPDQMRIEQRNADGTVHGTYSYLDPYGQIIKRQYWDTGSGFHVTSNSYPFSETSVEALPQQNAADVRIVQYTPEVQAARDLHFQLYQQALASFLPNTNSFRNDIRRNGSIPAEHVDGSDSFQKSNDSTTSSTVSPTTASPIPIDNNDSSNSSSSSSSPSPPSSSISTATETKLIRLHSNQNLINENKGTINIVEPDTENGSIVIQKPEYLRISWTTENKRYRVNPVASSENQKNQSSSSIKSTTTATATSLSEISNVTSPIHTPLHVIVG